jgi:hypothetical protein
VEAKVAHDAENPGRFVSRDLAPGEEVEIQLDTLISQRHEKRVASEGERDEEAAWKESERRVAEERRARNRREWLEFHSSLAASHRETLAKLVAHHEAEAERLLGGLS